MAKRKPKTKARKKSRATRPRRLVRAVAVVFTLLALLWCATGVWFVQHPRVWLDSAEQNWPRFLTDALYKVGNPLGDITDAIGITGHDVVYEYDIEAPTGSVLFAGEPVRIGDPAPNDIVTIDRGHYKIGWSPSLHHPVWVAYHVPPEAAYEVGKRPNFNKDRSVHGSPGAGDYSRSNYDRGHMAPNYAIASRFGRDAQNSTFLMSNIVPQTPALNRGVWKDVEHRIAEFWSKRWGEIWVIVGTISETGYRRQTIGGDGVDIDVPKQFYQIMVAQDGMMVRAQSVIFEQSVSSNEWASRHLATIDEIESLSGLDFFPELSSFIQDPLEAELPSRLWPISFGDIFKLICTMF